MGQEAKIIGIANKKDVMEGAGVLVGRVLPVGRLGLEPLDPFLMLDHFNMKAGGPGFPEHPHRGFEILTYIMRGWAQHKDNFGNEGKVEAGGMMRLTAGKGMRHGEEGGSAEREGVIEGLQFWVNLDKADKGCEPSFQQAADADFSRITQAGGATVKVLVGQGSPVKIVTPIEYLDVSAPTASSFEWDIPAGHQGFAYVLRGTASVSTEGGAVAESQVIVLEGPGAFKVKNNADKELRFVFAHGKPHRQPVQWNGPFVD